MHARRLSLVLFTSVAVLGCGDDETSNTPGTGGAATTGGPASASASSVAGSTTGAGSGGGGAGGAGGAGGGTAGGEPVDEACTIEALAEPATGTTFYVAIDEPGADDDACDGLAPSDEGDGRCPFRTLGAIVDRGILTAAIDVRVELRAGTYVLDTWEGLVVEGAGTDESESVVLSAYRDEKPVLDVAILDVDECPAAETPGCVRQVVTVRGEHVIVQGLTIQNGLGYDMQVEGTRHEVRCNLFTYSTPNVPEGNGRSDQLKLVSGDTVVHHNEFTNWESQAVDTAGSREPGLVIEDNEMHHPHERGCGAVGIKSGVRDIVVRRNRIHDITGAECVARAVLGGGGEGTPRPDEYSAFRVAISDNRVWNVNARFANFSSCDGCSFTDNDASGVVAGVIVRDDLVGSSACSAGPSGCLPTRDLRIEGNRMRDVLGDGGETNENIFVGVFAESEAEGLVVGDNLYCAEPTADDARFAWVSELVDFATWQDLSATDATSNPVAADDPRCDF